jgi:hypothetical protein
VVILLNLLDDRHHPGQRRIIDKYEDAIMAFSEPPQEDHARRLAALNQAVWQIVGEFIRMGLPPSLPASGLTGEMIIGNWVQPAL